MEYAIYLNDESIIDLDYKIIILKADKVKYNEYLDSMVFYLGDEIISIIRWDDIIIILPTLNPHLNLVY